MKASFIPMHLLGSTFTLRGDFIEFNRAGNRETIFLCDTGWVFATGKKRVHISNEDMDTILVGWFTQFDHSTNGYCKISVRMVDANGNPTWVTYRN